MIDIYKHNHCVYLFIVGSTNILYKKKESNLYELNLNAILKYLPTSFARLDIPFKLYIRTS
jgi:hypothetical protein